MKSRIAALTLLALLALSQPSVSAGQTGSAVLSVSSGVTGQGPRGLIASMPLMLLKESFAAVLEKKGTSLAAWANACRMAMPGCQEGLAAAESVFVDGTVVMDPNAKTTFDRVPPGSYYLFGQTMSNNQFLVWDLPIKLGAGTNAITLDQGNTVQVDARAAAPAGPRQPAPATDPSIAKARAAKIDTKIFGIPLGETLDLPPCQIQLLAVQQKFAANCLRGGDLQAVGDLLSLLAPVLGDLATTADPELVAIQLANDSCPAWLDACTISGRVHDGVLVAVALTTGGHNVEQTVAKELRAKYGQSVVLSTQATVRPDIGNPFDVTNLEWFLPGLHVQYDVVLHDDSRVINYMQGVVRIETEQAYEDRHKKEQQDAAKRKL